MREDLQGIARNQYVSGEKKGQAREFRNVPTPSEVTAWRMLRGRKIYGLKFRRQQVVGRYVLDYYCAERRLALELDGGVHDAREEYDAVRDAFLSSQEIRVLRLRNEDLTEEKLKEMLSPYVG